MIPPAAIQAWAVDRPWPNLAAIEQDLLLARLIIEFAQHPLLLVADLPSIPTCYPRKM